MQISKMESNLLESVKIKSLIVFSIKDLCLLLNLKRSQVYDLIKSLKKKNLIKILKNGCYSMNDVDEFILAPYTMRFSYISFFNGIFNIFNCIFRQNFTFTFTFTILFKFLG